MPDATHQPLHADAEADTASSRTLEELPARLEAILLTADRPVPHLKLAQAAGLLEGDAEASPGLAASVREEVVSAIGSLNREYEEGGRSFRIEEVAGGYRVMTLARYARCVAAFQQQKSQNRLSKAAVETLAIIAYRQPVTRAEVESIRGVACGEVLKTLMDHRLVTIQGRADELGRPMLYGTTRQFLDTFGLASLKDLPPMAEFGGRA